MSVSQYVKSLPALCRPHLKGTPHLQQRLYMKDIDCPSEWQTFLETLIPPSLFYMNQSPKPYNGPGSRSSHQVPQSLTTTKGEIIAKSGDLMSSLPEEMRAQNLMCYVGHEGTYTPAHQEMCASLGHNIMVEASSDNATEDGQPTKRGSSIWLMTETKDRHIVSEYWTSVLGHDIELEDHFAQMNAWKGAPFKAYVVEQRPGDLILIPPLAAHQVWNRGTRTMKVAWNRTTVETLKMALGEALPKARIICRDEQYKNKAVVFYSLQRYSKLLKDAPSNKPPAIQQLWKDFENLFSLYTDILLSETLSPALPGAKDIQYIEFDGNVTCSYCRCNIFNRFLTCPSCAKGEDDSYDICMDCYVLGRSCKCISRLEWVEQFHWQFLRERYESWRHQIIAAKNGDKAHRDRFPVLHFARSKLRRKPIAEICQEQLVARPWVNTKVQPPPVKAKSKSITPSEAEDEFQPRKRRRLQADQHQDGSTGFCHMCQDVEPSWKLAECSGCDLKYCYAILFCAFDTEPEETMGQSYWLCPRCQKRCNCTPCQKDPTMKPHEPNHVLLGHDTRKIADPRSVESLVNLRLSNVQWLPRLEENSMRRLQRRLQETEQKREEVWKRNDIVMGTMSPRLMSTNEIFNSPKPIAVDP